MQRLGVPAEQLRDDLAAQPGGGDDADDVFVAPHLAQVVWVFSKLHGQWRAVADGQGGLFWLGLDAAGVDSVLRRRGIEPAHPERFYDWLDVLEEEGARQRNSR